jgi:DnaK suppressor protein
MDEDKTRKHLEAERGRLQGIRDRLLADPASGELDGATSEQEKNQSILEHVNDDLAAAEDALERLDAGTYGSCLACGEPIEPARLEALPFARYCVQDQAAAERPSGLPRKIG